jgi:serine protease
VRLTFAAAVAAAFVPLTARSPQLRTYPVLPLARAMQFTEAAERQLDYLPGEVLVKFRDGVGAGGQARAVDAVRGRPLGDGDFRWAGDVAVVRDLAQRDARALAAAMMAQPEVEYAEPNWLGTTQAIPNDPSYAGRQWNLQQLRMPAAWDIAPGGNSSVVVAIVDSGVTAVAPETLRAKTWSGSAIVDIDVPVGPSPDLPIGRFTRPADFIASESSPSSFVFDSDGHGTHVAGTVGQATNNGISLAGMAYNVTIMPIKVCRTYWDRQFTRSANGIGGFEPVTPSSCPTSATAAGIRYAADNGAHVINMSLGGFPQSTTLQNALAYAVNAGVFVAISNGNSFEEGNEPSYPAAFAPSFQGVMSVASFTRNNTKAWYSTTNAMTEIAAYGGDLRTGSANGIWQMTLAAGVTDPETVIFPRFDQYQEHSFQGTSMASPHVAGLAALLHSRGILTPAAKEAVIIGSALDVGATGRDNQAGHGLIQPRDALFGRGIRR